MPALLPTTTGAFPAYAYPGSAYSAGLSASGRPGWQATGSTWAPTGTVAAPRLQSADTRQRLLELRVEKLIPFLAEDWRVKQEYFQGVNAIDAMARLMVTLETVPLSASAISAGFTYEQSLYVRAELPTEIGGTLYIEVGLGPDADLAEDTLAVIRQHKQEKWSASGAFGQVLSRLNQYLA